MVVMVWPDGRNRNTNADRTNVPLFVGSFGGRVVMAGCDLTLPLISKYFFGTLTTKSRASARRWMTA